MLQATSSAAVHRTLIIMLAARHRLPAIYASRAYVTSGGLASYGPDYVDQFRRSASYVDRILKGEMPADLPAQAPTKYELVINLKSAKALGLEIPPSLLACRRGDRIGPDHRSHLLTRGMRPSTSGAGRSTSSARVRSWVMPNPQVPHRRAGGWRFPAPDRIPPPHPYLPQSDPSAGLSPRPSCPGHMNDWRKAPTGG